MQSQADPLAAVQPPQQHLEDQHDVGPDNLQQEQPDRTQGGSSSSSEGSSQRPSWRKRLIRYGIAAIQAVLLLELAVTVVQPFLSESSKAKSEDSDDSDQGFDPADILMDYFTGRRGLSALQLLSNKQLRQAVDNLVTEDYQELGVKDRGAEIKEIVEEVIRVREQGPKPTPQPERVGLGKVGPLRFKNSRPAAKRPAADKAAAADTAAADGTETAAAGSSDKPS